MQFYTHRCEAQLEARDVGGRYNYTVVYLPEALAATLPFEGRPLRVDVEVQDFPFSAAWQPAQGRWYLMLNKRLLKSTGLAVGDVAEVRFRVADPDEVEVPEALELALAADAQAARVWAELTPGRRRAWAHRVASAKTANTRERRVHEVVERVRAGGALR